MTEPRRRRFEPLPMPEVYRKAAEERAARATHRPLNFFRDAHKRSRAKQTGRDADPRRVLPLNSYAWQKLRATVLEGEPLCRHCAARGLTVPSTDADHIDGDPSNNALENLAGLCHSCHSTKTAIDHGKRVKTGHGADGLPLTGEWAK